MKKIEINNVFPHIDNVNVQSIKLYYLDILENTCDDLWTNIYNHFKERTKVVLDGGGVLVTSDHAATLTDGPTIFITEEPEKIGKFYLNQAKIPKEYLENINRCIDFNNTLNGKIVVLEKSLEDKMKKI